MKKMILLFSLLFSITPSLLFAADSCYSERMQSYIIHGMRIGEAIYQAQEECREFKEPSTIEQNESDFSFAQCLNFKHQELIKQGKHPQDAYMQASYFCQRADPNYEYDPRPTTTNFLYTLFIQVGIFRDQAILRAYEIVYGPGGKGPKTKEDIDAKIKHDMYLGYSFHEAVWRIFYSR